MKETLESYLRVRTQELGFSLTELSRRSGLSRQTIYGLSTSPERLPSLQTVVALAEVLHVHPMRLLHLIFASPHAKPEARSAHKRRGDLSAFVRDVSFPDGALVLPGQRFVKTWEMQNVGAVPWEGRILQCMDEEIIVYAKSGEVLRLAHNLIPTLPRVPVPYTAPGQNVRLSVEFTAPEPPGTVLSYWKSTFADGRLCFPSSRGLWVKVRVNKLADSAQSGDGNDP